ncbi:uncharacterized protein LOC133735506 [Rosa rugosa]|uniref:uncharacterized protein LOC133735506 n=1 Tax=Rosa rugosa TaxID=74645 RepID=UPI002B40BD48|nr:uncharacterized protein LOC133735506 [Rosa rugosa]
MLKPPRVFFKPKRITENYGLIVSQDPKYKATDRRRTTTDIFLSSSPSRLRSRIAHAPGEEGESTVRRFDCSGEFLRFPATVWTAFATALPCSSTPANLPALLGLLGIRKTVTSSSSTSLELVEWWKG